MLYEHCVVGRSLWFCQQIRLGSFLHVVGMNHPIVLFTEEIWLKDEILHCIVVTEQVVILATICRNICCQLFHCVCYRQKM